MTCEMPRRKVDPDPERVTAWRRRLTLGEEVSILFVGNLGYPPNRRAVDFIIEGVVPQLASARRRWKIILAAGNGPFDLFGRARSRSGCRD